MVLCGESGEVSSQQGERVCHTGQAGSHTVFHSDPAMGSIRAWEQRRTGGCGAAGGGDGRQLLLSTMDKFLERSQLDFHLEMMSSRR